MGWLVRKKSQTQEDIYFLRAFLRGPSTLTGELRTGDCKTTLEAKKNLAYYISSEILRDAEIK